jgi:hypothetical protein
MMLVVLVVVAIFLGHLFGGERGPYYGAAVAAILVGIFLWQVAPREFVRQLRIIERSGATLANPDEFRRRFLLGARMPAVLLVVLGLAALIWLIVTTN